uniref:Myosin essential light chain n=1 Tax=Echinococcus granulosus TaxID=6210 RepID=A0A068WE95_ECHGR|nr:myosin essential light chain [Echinococcus granulosus]
MFFVINSKYRLEGQKERPACLLQLDCVPNWADLSKAEIEDIKEVFDLFDFWDGRDGMIDAVKVPDLLRCAGMNPTIKVSLKHGATKKAGEKQYKFDEFLPVYQAIIKEKEGGTFADYMEAFKTFDREGQGVVSAAELGHVLSGYGERLSDEEIDEIIKLTKLHVDLDGNVKYEEFIKGTTQLCTISKCIIYNRNYKPTQAFIFLCFFLSRGLASNSITTPSHLIHAIHMLR